LQDLYVFLYGVFVTETLGLRDRKKLETWRAIRSAAVELFLERGYEAVSVDDIAAAANVAPSTFFNYFATKEAVAFDPDPADFATRQALLAARPPGEPLWVSLRAALLEYVAGHGESIDTHKRLTAGSYSLTESRRDTLDQIHDELLEWATARSPDASALETALPVNVALAAILTAFDAWQVDEGMARLAELARDCLDQASIGLDRRPTT
jgi:AcrR family transcriptional regulator